MSKRQSDILAFIAKHNEEKGYSPTHREIGTAVGLLSQSTVHGHIERLASKGLITFEPSSPRTIKLVEQSSTASEVKVMTVEDGQPTAIAWNGNIYVIDPMG